MNVRLKKTYAVITLALAAVMLLTGLPMQRTEAAPDDGSIEVQSQVGLGGRYKEEKWYPLRLTLTNNTKENLSGEAVLSVVSQTGMTTDYLVPVDLPAGTPVGITIGLPGTTRTRTKTMIATPNSVTSVEPKRISRFRPIRLCSPPQGTGNSAEGSRR